MVPNKKNVHACTRRILSIRVLNTKRSIPFQFWKIKLHSYFFILKETHRFITTFRNMEHRTPVEDLRR